jgi:hypothetical protein
MNKQEQNDEETILFVITKTTLTHCVACGAKLENLDHHCHPHRIESIENRRAKFDNFRSRTPSVSERIATGFGMLQDDEG